MLVGQQIGPFLIDKELGSGAMGTVYRGTYTPTGVRVAIKIMAPGLGTTNPNATQRFEREAAILKQLKHPNIVRLYGVGKAQGMRYYAMEYIEGESLDKVMARRDRMTWEEVVTLGQQLCAALQHAHEKGVIHRDLKPSNLMILPDGTLKLTDFGIAKDLDSTALTSANCTVGTASYMSPEQCRGERDLTNKSDLYSLGIVFYELVTGRKPFVADNAMQMFLLHVNGTFVRPSKLVLDLPVWFDNLICQMLEKDPQQRPLDAAMVAHTLGTIQEKVEAQLSAGVDAVRSRRIDRPRGERKGDETDREAARTLKFGKKKTKRKSQAPPFYERAWFVGLGLFGVLLALGTFCYFAFLAPTSMDRLHAQAKRLMETNDAAKWDEALEGPLHEFEVHYPAATGDKADQMRRWAADAQYRRCLELVKKHLQRRRELKVHNPSDDEEKIAFDAAGAEEKGDFKKARESWESLKKEAGGRAWGVFATRQLDEMNRADQEDARLQKMLNNLRERHREPAPDDPDRELLTAIRYEQFGDSLAAQKDFEKLRDAYVEKPDRRVSYLFAAKKAVEMKTEAEKKFGAANPLTVRLSILDDRLKVAQDQEANDPSAAYVTLLEVIALYQSRDETEIKERVLKAQDRAKYLREKVLKLLDSPGN
jgi:serine/threonine-protein kinase